LRKFIDENKVVVDGKEFRPSNTDKLAIYRLIESKRKEQIIKPKEENENGAE
jgi:hypothetical protein